MKNLQGNMTRLLVFELKVLVLNFLYRRNGNYNFSNVHNVIHNDKIQYSDAILLKK